MPLFMDIHVGVNVSLEELQELHCADLEVQHKYGVSFHRFWLNEDSKTVFCLAHGPNKEACQAVHREAHGGLPCNVIEVFPEEYEFFLGQAKLNLNDRAHLDKAVPDTGFRVFGHVEINHPSSRQNLSLVKKIVNELEKFNGTIVDNAEDGFKCVFTSSLLAVEFAISLTRNIGPSYLDTNNSGISREIQVGLSASDPVTEDDDQFFAGSLELAMRLSKAARPGQIIITSSINNHLVKESTNLLGLGDIKVLNYAEEKFLSRLIEITNKRLSEPTFNVTSLSRHMGLSRPQLYRKITSLVGLSPKNFLKERRMKRAAKLIRRRFGNISEIANEVGFNNPSHFSKCFSDQFGLVPSAYRK